MARTHVFIDGHYAHNALMSIGLQERDLDWQALLERFAGGAVVARVAWHAVGELEGVDWAPSRATRYCPPASDEATFLAEAQAWYREECDRVARVRADVAASVQLAPPAELRMRPTGTLRVNPFRRQHAGAYGIDVGMAVDLVAEIDYFDVALVIADCPGLADAFRFLRERGKRVLRGVIDGAAERAHGPLDGAVDETIVVGEDELNDRRSPLLAT